MVAAPANPRPTGSGFRLTRTVERIEGPFRAEISAAGAELEAPVTETVALVEAQLPQIDTAAVRARLGWRQQPRNGRGNDQA